MKKCKKMTNMKCYPTLSSHQMVDILVLFVLSEERKSVENNIKHHKKRAHCCIQRFAAFGGSENLRRMGELRDWPLQFGENNSTHFRPCLSTKSEEMWLFWGLFYPLPPLDQCWILWLWSNLCICQYLSFQHWLGGEGVGDHFFTFMWSDASMMFSFFVAFLSVKTIKLFLKFWIIFPKNVHFEGVSL